MEDVDDISRAERKKCFGTLGKREKQRNQAQHWVRYGSAVYVSNRDAKRKSERGPKLTKDGSVAELCPALRWLCSADCTVLLRPRLPRARATSLVQPTAHLAIVWLLPSSYRETSLIAAELRLLSAFPHQNIPLLDFYHPPATSKLLPITTNVHLKSAVPSNFHPPTAVELNQPDFHYAYCTKFHPFSLPATLPPLSFSHANNQIPILYVATRFPNPISFPKTYNHPTGCSGSCCSCLTARHPSGPYPSSL